MTDKETTQTAVDATNAPAEPGVAGNDAQETGDELSKLLKEFDTQAAPAAPAPKTQPEPKAGTDATDIEQVVDQRIAQKLSERQTAEDVAKHAAELSQQYGVTPRLAKGWLDQMAREEPAVLDAFLNRHQNPAKWGRMWKSLVREFGKEQKQSAVDQNATEDRDAVTAAVRGASTKAPEGKAPDYSGMSNAEYREAHKRDYGYYPNV